MAGETNGRISVSEDKLAAALAGLELALSKQIQSAVGPIYSLLAAKADAATVIDIQRRLAALELKQAGATAVSAWTKFWIGTVGVGVLAAVSTLVWLASGH